MLRFTEVSIDVPILSGRESLPASGLFRDACRIARFSGDVAVQDLLDLDANPATGCSVSTADGPFYGAEQILITTVETTALGNRHGDPGRASGLRRSSTTSRFFGSPILVDDSGWPVGAAAGTGGLNVIETYIPVSVLDITPDLVRIGVAASDDQGDDALLTVGGGQSIYLQSVFDIPALTPSGLAAFGLLCAMTALLILRKRQHSLVVLLIALALFSAAGTAWAACLLDGSPADWTGLSPLATDATGDGPVGSPPRSDLRTWRSAAALFPDRSRSSGSIPIQPPMARPSAPMKTLP